MTLKNIIDKMNKGAAKPFRLREGCKKHNLPLRYCDMCVEATIRKEAYAKGKAEGREEVMETCSECQKAQRKIGQFSLSKDHIQHEKSGTLMPEKCLLCKIQCKGRGEGYKTGRASGIKSGQADLTELLKETVFCKACWLEVSRLKKAIKKAGEKR